MAERPAPQSPGRTLAPSVEVFVRDDEADKVIRQALNGLGLTDAAFVTGNVETAIATLAAKPSPRLLIVDISGVSDPISRINALADVCEPNTGVIVIGDRNDIVLYRDLKQAGIAEYFFKPLVGALITRTCNTVMTGSTGPQSARTGKLIFVLGVRGGVGATTIAVNTAWYLAEKRQRWVMLLDLDLQSGDAALQLDVTPSHALREAFEHPERVDKLFLERAVIQVENRIDLLASLEPLSSSITFDENAVVPLIGKLLDRYRFIFVDVPASGAAGLIRTLQMPSTTILVSDGTLVSARDVARWREWIGPDTPERTTLHVLNKHGAPGGLPDPDFARAAGRAPDIVVPFDRAIGVEATLGIKNAGKNTAVKRGLAPLLRHLSGEQAKARRSIFQRMFG